MPRKNKKSIFSKHKSERAKADYPRISLKSVFYVMRIYHKAVGKKSIFFSFYRIYNAIIPSVMAIISGYAVTCIANALSTHDVIPFVVIAIVLLGIELFNIILSAINDLLSISTEQDVYVYVGEQIASKYIQIPIAIRETREFADKFERVRSFGSNVVYVTQNIVGVAASVISLFSVVIATLTISPLITLVVIVAAIPSSILTLRISAKQRRNWRAFSRDRRVAWAIEQKLTNSNTALEIEMNGLSENLIHRMIKCRRHSQEQDVIDARRFLWPRFGANSLEKLTSYAVMIYVAIMIILKNLEIGQFFTIRTLLNQLAMNIQNLFNSISTINENLVNATDYMEYIETPAKSNGDIKITSTPKIEFRNVSFKYPNSKTKALDNVSFIINPGDSLAIVGQNGAGKTTIVKLLVGAYEPTEGVILINDQPFERIERSSYLAQLGALFQDYQRYDFATLGENVWYGDVSKKYSPKAIRAAMREADLADFDKNYDAGLDQILSKDFDEKSTADLSGGQWQRLSIARVFFRSPNVLLLDEPTASIDAKAEYEIFKNIIARQTGKSTVIISHRFSTVRKAQQIIVLEKGKIIEFGTHEELISDGGVYKEMFELQAEGYN